MPTTVELFPVDCGDMTLVKFGDSDATTLLIDVNIRAEADDPDGDKRDVAKDLRDRLKTDANGRPYVDGFLLSHPDEDHCRGLAKHFYLGPLSEYPDDKKPLAEKKIVVREMWSSPIVFRRASKSHVLCEDALAWSTEARRRVKVNREQGFSVADGDRIQIMGKDVDGKTDDLGPILRLVDEEFSTINGKTSPYFTAFLLGPLEPKDDDEEEECLAKNQSSVIVNLTLAADLANPKAANFLTGGDAEVFIWNRLWERHQKDPTVLEYDLLQTPHHCSWRSLSYDSWSELGEKAAVDNGARSALAQARDGAIIVASSKPIRDDDKDPPCVRAKREYEEIVDEVGGEFFCTGEYPDEDAVEPLKFTVTAEGFQPPSKKEGAAKSFTILSSVSTPLPHG